MNIANCIKRFAVCFLVSTSLSIPKLHANTNDISEQEDQLKQKMRQMLNVTLSRFKELDAIVQDLLLLVSSNAIRTKNKRACIEHAKDLRDQISGIIDAPFVQIEVTTLSMLNALSVAIMNHLIKALDKHFTELPLFDATHLMTRVPTTKTASLKEIETGMAQTSKLMKNLKVKAKSAGLRWYNKAYRVLDKNIIQPGAKWKLGVRGRRAALIALFGTYIAWANNDNKLTWLRNGWLNLGPAPHRPSGALSLEFHKDRPLKWFGTISNFWSDKINGNIPFATPLLGIMSTDFAAESSTILNTLGNWLNIIHNRMRGGTYAERPEQKFIQKPRFTFKDLVGLDHQKEVLSFIIKYLEEPERFDRAKLTPEKGYLLTGPTRTGKTALAEALVGEIKEMYKRKGRDPEEFQFFVLPAPFIIQEGGIAAIIERAKTLAPCVLFIDELDLLSLQRTEGSDKHLLSQFLSGMSGCLENDPEKVVIMLAATNRPEHLDKALRQRGRFGKEIRFEYPGFTDRKKFLIKKIGTLANLENFDIDKLALETEGASYEDLHAMTRAAFQKVIIKGDTLSQQILELCLDEEVRHIIMREDPSALTATESELIAIHQAGHALATILLGNTLRLAKTTIRPYLTQLREELISWQYYTPDDQKQKKIKYGRTFTYHNHDTKHINRLADKLALCQISLAGHAAESIILGACGYSYDPESLQGAFEIAKSIASEGMTIDALPDDIKTHFLNKTLALKEQCLKDITALLAQHKDKIAAVVQALLEKKSLTGKEVAAICGMGY